MKIKALLPILFLLLAANVGSVSAQGFSTISPSMLNLALDQGEATTETVSLTIHPLCVRPFLVDVVASIPDALVANLTGVLLNGCGGDTSVFDIMITGTGQSQTFDLQFVDTEFGGVIDSIPVTITAPSSQPCNVELSLSMRGRTLVMGLGLGLLEPGDFNLFFSAFNQTYNLLENPIALPVIDPPQRFTSTIPDFPDLGTVGFLATITNDRSGIRCSAWQTVDTGP